MFAKRPINVVLCLFCTFVFVCVIENFIKPYILSSFDRLLIASRVRDTDELRLATANTQIGKWRLKEMLPLSLIENFRYGGRNSFLVLIITSNRGLHKVDAFEPYYLTQSSVALIKSLMLEKTNTYSGIGTVRPMFCAARHLNDTERDLYSNELKRLQQIFGSEAFIRPSQVYGAPCKPSFDMVSCLSVALRNYSTVDYVVLLEDDILITKNFLPALDLFAKSRERAFLNLYKPRVAAFSSVTHPCLPILYFFALMPSTTACYIIYSQFIHRHIRLLLSFIVLILVVLILFTMRISSGSIGISFSNDLESDFISAAVVLPRVLALKLASIDLSTDCKSSYSTLTKSNLVKKVARDSGYGYLTTKSSVAIHIGMYSQLRSDLHDPTLFPHWMCKFRIPIVLCSGCLGSKLTHFIDEFNLWFWLLLYQNNNFENNLSI